MLVLFYKYTSGILVCVIRCKEAETKGLRERYIRLDYCSEIYHLFQYSSKCFSILLKILVVPLLCHFFFLSLMFIILF